MKRKVRRGIVAKQERLLARLGDENSRMRQALGLLSTLAPEVEMDGDNPLAMAQSVVSYVTKYYTAQHARITKLEEEVKRLTEQAAVDARAGLEANRRVYELNAALDRKQRDASEAQVRVRALRDELREAMHSLTASRYRTESLQMALTATRRHVNQLARLAPPEAVNRVLYAGDNVGNTVGRPEQVVDAENV